MRVWVGHANAGGQEVDVLRVTLSLVSVSAGLRSITQQRFGRDVLGLEREDQHERRGVFTQLDVLVSKLPSF
jgi:hypothetical protein